MKKRVKRTFSFHHWLGLLAGIFLLISSMTGSVLVFHHEIDRAQFADSYTLKTPATALHIDNSLKRMLEVYPATDIRIPALPKAPDQVLKYEIRHNGIREWVFVHPQTGETLTNVARADKRLVHVLLDIHYNLFAGTIGKIVVFLGGLSLIVLSVTGFLLYRRSILKVLSFKQRLTFKSQRSFFSSLHRIVGVWGLLFNLFISITGTWVAFTILHSAITPAGTPVPENVPSALASVDGALNQVKYEYPAFEANYLRIAGSTLTISGRLKTDPVYYGPTLNNLQFDLSTGKIRLVNFVKDKPWNERMLLLFKPLHFGDYAGLGIKLLYCFLGMLPGILAVSGFFIWQLKNSKTDTKIPKRKMPMRYSQPKVVQV